MAARSTARAHCPASASRKTRSSSVILRGRPKENRSAPSGAPAASSGSPTQDRSSSPATISMGASSSSRRSASGSSASTGRRVAIARVITPGLSSRMSRVAAACPGGMPARVDHPQPAAVQQGHRGPLRADRGAAHLGDHLDDLLDGQRLGQHRRGLLQPRGAQRGRRQLLGQPAAHLLGLALAGDVGTGADPLDDPPVSLDRHGADVVMAVGAGPGPDPVAVVEGLTGLDAGLPVALHPVPVLGVDHVQPAVAPVLLLGLPGDPAPFGAVLGDLAVGVRDPDDLRAALDEGSVPLLAAPDGLLGQLPARDIDRDQHDARDVPLLVV